MAADTYCIDASSLIKLKQDYRRNVFSGVWDKIEELAQADRLIAPDEEKHSICPRHEFPGCSKMVHLLHEIPNVH
jgi:hypothetical protein